MTSSHDNLPTCWKNLQQCIDSGVNRILLYGPPGTGKTYFGLKYGNVSAGAHRLICTEDMTNFDVTGGFMPGSDGFQWLYGAGIKAWEGDGVNGGRLVVDEIDKAGGDAETGKVLMHQATRLVATCSQPCCPSWTLRTPQNGSTLRPVVSIVLARDSPLS